MDKSSGASSNLIPGSLGNSGGNAIISPYNREVLSGVPATFEELMAHTGWGVSPTEIGLDYLYDVHNQPEAGTGEWIFHEAEYQRWLESSESKLLWLCGGPGTGKTMLAKRVAAEFLKNVADPPRKVGLVFHFFSPELGTEGISADEAELSQYTLSQVARNLLYGILQQDWNLSIPCMAELRRQGDRFFTNSSSLWRVLGIAIQDSGCGRKPVYILIDGLDTLQESLCGELIGRILGLKGTGTVKIFLSSRNVPHVSNNLHRGLPDNFPEHTKIDLDTNNSVKVDVQTFIRHRVNAWKWDSDPKERATKILLEKSGGIFLWASLAIENLTRFSSGPDFEGFLEEYPVELKEVYGKMLRTLSRRGGSEGVLSMIRHVALALRPLTFDEFGYIIDMEEEAKTKPTAPHIWTSGQSRQRTKEEIRRYVQSSLGLLRATDKDVSIVHHTAIESIFDENNQSGPPVFPKSEYELTISWNCFQYLHRAFSDPEKLTNGNGRGRHNGPQDSGSEPDPQGEGLGETRWEMARKDPQGAVAQWPYLRYAAESWFIHARRSIEISAKLWDDSPYNWLQHQFFATSDVIRKPWIELCGDPKMDILAGEQAQLDIAVCLKLTPLVKMALSDFTQGTERRQSPLHLAAKLRSEEYKTLIAHGGRSLLTAQDQDGNTPLHQSVKMALSDFTRGTERRQSPLHLAAKLRSEEYKTLIAHGGRSLLTAQDQDGNTPLHQAAISGYWPMLKDLLAKFASPGYKACSGEINKKNNRGNTPLHLAVQFDHPDIFDLLVKHGADPTIKNNHGATASELETDLRRIDSLGFQEPVGGIAGEPRERGLRTKTREGPTEGLRRELPRRSLHRGL